MTTTEIKENIYTHFKTNREFIKDFNQRTGVGLNETTLSRQLSGKIRIGKGWMAAYIFFFDYILAP